MKNIVIYSSRTGNTKKVAEAIAQHYACEILDIREVDPTKLEGYDYIILGNWNDKGTADQSSLQFYAQLKDKHLGVFQTLGAEPDSEHARQSLQTCVAMLEAQGNKVKASFLCQGRIDPRLTEMFKKMGEKSPHKMDEKRMQRHREAAKHPDEEDLRNAIQAFRELF